MPALAEIQVVPIGVGVSVRKEVTRAHEIIRDSGLKVRLHAYGTNVEGDLDTILATIRRVHETLHAEGTVRLSTGDQDRHADGQERQSRREAIRYGRRVRLTGRPPCLQLLSLSLNSHIRPAGCCDRPKLLHQAQEVSFYGFRSPA